MHRIQYLLFDFDGTLADSKKVALAALNQLADKHGYKRIEPAALPELSKLTLVERCRKLGWPVYRIPFLATELYQLYKAAIHKVSLFEGIPQTLSELQKRGYRLAIISSNAEQNIRDFLEANEIRFIQDVICSNQVFGKDKVIRKFLKSRQLQPENVIYVGDEIRDIVACKKCGIKIIWVSWGFDPYELVQTENPDFIVHQPAELLQLLPTDFQSQTAL
jgi:phosphoglycolate phosphatase